MVGEGLLDVLATLEGVEPDEKRTALDRQEHNWEEELNAPIGDDL